MIQNNNAGTFQLNDNWTAGVLLPVAADGDDHQRYKFHQPHWVVGAAGKYSASDPHSWFYPGQSKHRTSGDGGAFGGAIEFVVRWVGLIPPVWSGDDALAHYLAGSSARRVFFFALEWRRAATIATMSQPETFTEFWSFEVLAHQQLATRIFHTIGTLSGWSLLAAAIILRRPWLGWPSIVVPMRSHGSRIFLSSTIVRRHLCFRCGPGWPIRKWWRWC